MTAFLKDTKALQRLKDVYEGRSKESIALILPLGDMPIGLGTTEFWNGQAVKQIKGEAFSTTAKTYIERMLEHLKQPVVTKANMGKVARFLTGTEPKPNFGTLFAFGDTEQGATFWQAIAAKGPKSGADLPLAAREYLTKLTLEAFVS